MDFIGLIAAHGAWRHKLRDAIDSPSTGPSPEEIEADDRCELGECLATIAEPLRRDELYAEVRETHADFHREAARVLRMSIGGDRDGARASLATGGEFARLSGDLTRLLYQWRKRAAG